jgi:hypothetical protein
MNEQSHGPNLGRIEPPPQESIPARGKITRPPQPVVPSVERALRLIDQLLTKTQEGKLPWTTGFEDGQFKTVLPRGELAFVIQVKADAHRFLMLDEHQEIILDETVTRDESTHGQVTSSKDMLYDAIQILQVEARSRALQVNEKLAKAERLLAAI